MDTMKMSSLNTGGKMPLFGFILRLLYIFLVEMIQGTAGKEVLVLIVDYNGPIHQINTSDGTHSVVYRDQVGAENVAYDPILEHIYWSNIVSDQIQRVNLDGRHVNKIASVRRCQGMVVDPVSRLLFYSSNTTRVITKLSLTGTRESSVIARISSSNRPHDLTADVDKKKLYWTVLGNSPQIETSDYNGEQRERLLHAGRVPTALALDSTGTRLFWLDEHYSNNKLMALNLVDRTTSTVPYGTQGNLFDIDILNTTLYIIDMSQRYKHLHKLLQKIIFVNSEVFAYPYECPVGKYGTECDLSCGQCEGGQSCSRRSGQCPSGCQAGWRTRNCSKECQAGTYGSGCISVCGHCRHGNPCSKIDGLCPEGCADGWTGVNCDEECGDGYFGLNCSIPCGGCKDRQACDKSDGHCPGGCQAGWTGITCQNECGDGYFGLNCSIPCGGCKDRQACDKSDGHCPGGCQAGWTGITCHNECGDGYFGLNCSIPCGGCKDRQACDKSDGHCPGGCQAGWTGITCHNECGDGYFGLNCSIPCGGCKDRQACDKSDGHCPGGCQAGWTGITCHNGHGKGRAVTNASCDEPCESCYTKKVCTGNETNCSADSSGITLKHNYIPIVASVCTVGAVIAIIAIIAILVFFLRRRNDQVCAKARDLRAKDISVVYEVIND